MLSLISFCPGKPAMEEAAMCVRVLVLLTLLFFAGAAPAQRTQTPQQGGPRQIDGTVRIEGRTAPPGVLVLLDYAASEDSAPVGRGELGRAVTDSSGKFKFSLTSQGGAGNRRALFAVSVHYTGYKDSFQVVDLSFVPHGSVNIELTRDTSKDPPPVPPGGPSATISAHRPASSEAEEALRKGQQLLLEKHDPKASIESLRKAVKLDPRFEPAYLLLGTACVQAGEWTEAQSAFESASKIDPKDSQALLGLAVTLNAQQNFSGAQKLLQRSLELDPKSAEAHYELGKSFWGQGKWQEAEPHAREAIALKKDFPPAHVLMGNICLRHRDANAALQEFNEYLRLDPQGPLAPATKGMVEKIQKASGQH
jgi:Flp pilus assembly protein TadD